MRIIDSHRNITVPNTDGTAAVLNVIGADSAGPPTYTFRASAQRDPLPTAARQLYRRPAFCSTPIYRARSCRTTTNGFGGRPTRPAADRVNATDSHCTTSYNATRVMRAALRSTRVQRYNIQCYTTVEPVGSRSLLLHHRRSQHHRRHGRRQGWTKCARGAFGRQYTSNRVRRRSLGRVARGPRTFCLADKNNFDVLQRPCSFTRARVLVTVFPAVEHAVLRIIIIVPLYCVMNIICNGPIYTASIALKRDRSGRRITLFYSPRRIGYFIRGG